MFWAVVPSIRGTWDGFMRAMIQMHYIYCSVLFLLLWHQLHLRSSAIRSGSLGTPALFEEEEGFSLLIHQIFKLVYTGLPHGLEMYDRFSLSLQTLLGENWEKKQSNACLASVCLFVFNWNYECYKGKVQNAMTTFNEHPNYPRRALWNITVLSAI